MKKIFYKIDGGKMRVMETADTGCKPGDGWTETDNTELYKHDGDPAEWFTADMRRIPDEELVAQGKRVDKRGLWFNKETRESRHVYNLDEPIDENLYAKEAPIENEAYQLYDAESKKWVIDEKKKERAGKLGDLAKLKYDIAEAERKQIRPLKEIMRGSATNEDNKVFMENENIIQSLRPHVAELEEELKIA